MTVVDKRIQYIDIAKGLGIILVVVAHSRGPMTNFINMFHMPLFFFISGMFYNEKYSYNPYNMFINKIKSLYIPYVCYGVLFLALHNILVYSNIYEESRIYNFKDLIIEFCKIASLGNSDLLVGATWFLASLFIVSIMFSIYNFIIIKLPEKRKGIALLMLVAGTFIIGYYTNLPRGLSTALVGCAFYYSGYIYNREKGKIKINNIGQLIIFVTSLILLSILSHFTKVSMVSNEYTNIGSLLLSSASGIYMTFYISILIDKSKYKNLISNLGRNTIAIMALHLLSFKIITFVEVVIYNENIMLLSRFPVLYSSSGWWIVYSMVGIIIPLALKNIISNVKSKFVYTGSR